AMDMFSDCYESHRDFLVRYRTDLSYKPEHGNKFADGISFIRWDFYYVHPGMEQQMEENANKWKALYTKHNIEAGYRVFTGDIGTDMPMLVVVQLANNDVEYFTTRERQRDTFGTEGTNLWNETLSIVRKYESKTGVTRPDLSYMPSGFVFTNDSGNE
ncbi:MAG: hypothetical protein ACFCU6_10715, partial [Balneolaceae bacterium]